MDLTTHILMANRLYKEIALKADTELDYWHFLYGNIKPDINPQSIDWPHFLKDSIKELIHYCEYITVTPMSVRKFSVALGTVSHFVCDYYCLYHSEAYKEKNILEHIFYEKRLSFTFIKKCLQHKVEVTSEEAITMSIHDTIERFYTLYREEPHTLNLDVKYALNTAICVLKSLVADSKIHSRQSLDEEAFYALLKINGGGL